MNQILNHDYFIRARVLDVLEKTSARKSKKRRPSGGTSGGRDWYRVQKKQERKRARAAERERARVERARNYTPPEPSLEYERTFRSGGEAPTARNPEPARNPDLSMRRRPKSAPRGSVDVNEAIRARYNKLSAGTARLKRVPSDLLHGAIDLGGQLYYGGTGERIRGALESAREAMRDKDPARTRAIREARGRRLRGGLRDARSRVAGALESMASDNARRAAERRGARMKATQPYDPARAKAIRARNAAKVRTALSGARSRVARALEPLLDFQRDTAAENARRASERRGARMKATQPYDPAKARATRARNFQKVREFLSSRRPSVRPNPSTPPKSPEPKSVKPSSAPSFEPKKAPARVDVVDDVAKGSSQAKGLSHYGKYGLGAIAALGAGYGIHRGIKALRSKSDSKMKKVSSAPMNNGMPKNAVQHLLKTASAKLIEQEQELAQLRQWYQEAQVLTKAASVADRMVAAGQLDYSDRDEKAVELAANPERLPIVEEAINMMHNPSAFSVASISDEYSDARTARTQLESYLLGH